MIDTRSSGYWACSQGFSLSDFGDSKLEGYDTGLHTIKKITVRRGFEPPSDSDWQNEVRCLLMDRKRVYLTVSENSVNYNELGNGEEFSFTFSHVVPLVANKNDYQYIMSFVNTDKIYNGTTYLNLDVVKIDRNKGEINYQYDIVSIPDGNIVPVSGTRVFRNRGDGQSNASIWYKVEGTADLVVDLEQEDVATDLTPSNWQIGAHECGGLVPQLYSTSVTPISVEELKRPDLDCLPLTNPVTSSLSCEPVIIPNIPPNTISGTIKEFQCDV